MKDLTNKFVVTNRRMELSLDEVEDILTSTLTLGKDATFAWDDYGRTVSIADRTEEDV